MHTDPIGGPHGEQRVDGFEKKACAVFNRAAIAIRPFVRAVMKELIKEIAIRRMQLDAIETGTFRILCATPEIFDDAGNLIRLQRARHRISAHWTNSRYMAFRGDGARSDGRLPVMVDRVGDAADVPQLRHNQAAVGVNRRGDFLPSFDLLLAPDARRVRVANTLLRHGRGFSDDQPSARAQRVMLRVEWTGRVRRRLACG